MQEVGSPVDGEGQLHGIPGRPFALFPYETATHGVVCVGLLTTVTECRQKSQRIGMVG